MTTEYPDLMRKVSEFGTSNGLNTQDLYRETYDPSTTENDRWVISVSRKTSFDTYRILLEPRDEFSRDPEKMKLKEDVVPGTREEVEGYREKAIGRDSDYFMKQSIAYAGFVQPTPDFLARSTVEQVEIALHEAFHGTSKIVFEREREQLPTIEEEESYASIAGFLGAVHFFKGTELEQEAIALWEKWHEIGKLIVQFYEELNTIYEAYPRKPKDEIMRLREEIFAKADKAFGDNLGPGPMNNAKILYWYHFYGRLEEDYKQIQNAKTYQEIIRILTKRQRPQ